VKEVAHYLGNTPAVCRSSYIDPRVLDRYRAGETIAAALDGLAATTGDGTGTLLTQGAVEQALLSLLDDDDEQQAAA
jgi:DNA topoisomerase IB